MTKKKNKAPQHKEVESEANTERSRAIKKLNETKLKHELYNKGKKPYLVKIDNKTWIEKYK